MRTNSEKWFDAEYGIRVEWAVEVREGGLIGFGVFVLQRCAEFGGIYVEEEEAGASGKELVENEVELGRKAEVDESGLREIGCTVFSGGHGGGPSLSGGDVIENRFVH